MANLNNIITEEEVNMELEKLEHKYKLINLKTKTLSKDSIQHHTGTLLQDFDSLGIENSKEGNVYEQILFGTHQLINMYRRNISQRKETNVQTSKLKEHSTQLQRRIDLYEEELNHKKKEIMKLTASLTLSKQQCDNFKKEKLNLQQELKAMRRLIQMKENEWKHKFNQSKNENVNLKDTIEKNVGVYKSENNAIADVIHKYRINEEFYNDTINKLQENNQSLIQDILNLKHEIVVSLYENEE